jgi:hypothetical protein
MQIENLAGERLKGRVAELIQSLSDALNLCDPVQYTLPLPMLSGSTIGEHTRHIIEFFQCLNTGINRGEVDYGKRERNRQLETDKLFAIHTFQDILSQLPLEERACMLIHEGKDEVPALAVTSGYYRELIYTIEHAVHHMAIIKIGLKSLQLDVDKDFGVAPSTLEYRAACAS